MKDENYPMNLLLMAYGNDTETIEKCKANPELEYSFETALMYLATENTRNVVHLYDKQGLTYKAIADLRGLSPQTIREYRVKTAYKIKKYLFTQFLVEGAEKTLKLLVKKAYDDGYDDGYDEGVCAERKAVMMRLLETKDTEVSTEVSDATSADVSDNIYSAMCIGEAHFPIRLYNALSRRYGKEMTLGELAKVPVKELAKTRNIGRKSFKDLIRKLTQLGFDTSRHKALLKTI